MAEGVRVRNLEALKFFKIALLKFGQTSNVALGDAESEVQRVLSWLEMDQVTFWQGQIRKLNEAVSRAKDAVRGKKLFKDSTGRPQSAVDEERLLSQLQRKLEIAAEKLVATRSHSRKLTREFQLFKGGVQRFATSVQADIPRATSRLENMLRLLEQYMNVDFESAYELAGQMPRGMRGGGAGGGVSGVGELRKLTPPGEVRDAAVAASWDAKEAWTIVISPADQKRLSRLSTLQVPMENYSPDARVVFAKATPQSQRIYCEHVEATGEDDTGWYFGPAGDQGIQSFFSVRITELLSARPDLKHVLTLPQGAVVVANVTGIESVFDQAGEDHWSAALAVEAYIAAKEAEDAADVAPKPSDEPTGESPGLAPNPTP